MTPTEKQLLNNALDALDRLFDRQSSSLDVWALLYATGEALRGTAHHPVFDGSVIALRAVVQSVAAPESHRDYALEATDGLRHYLAGVLPLE